MKKILFVSENYNMMTGYATYANAVLNRFHESGKYEIADFAIGMTPEQAVQYAKPWHTYANSPSINAPEHIKQQFMQNPEFNHGSWRFDVAVAHFRPDIVCSIKDPWADASFISRSPLLPFFHWLQMPTVDSAPQKQEWISWFLKADGFFSYSEYGKKILEKESRGKIKVSGVASPAIDDRYKILDFKDNRAKLGINPEWKIVGTVMRNQIRKLYPELMKAFKLYLEKAPTELANKSYLYLHTGYPEKMGWQIPELISQYGLTGKVLTTYICKSCNKFQCSFFMDAITQCKHCGQKSAFTSNSAQGLSVEDLVKIYNVFDLYAQYAICEGFGMPALEAAGCGVPVMATNYSAMEDVVRWTNGYPLAVGKFFKEMGTKAERAYPDNEIASEIMLSYLGVNDYSIIESKRKQVRKKAFERYHWDKTAKVWMDYFDNWKPSKMEGQWNSPARILQMPNEIPNFQNHQTFVEWVYGDILREPEGAYEYAGAKMLRDLNFGADMEYGSLAPVNRELVLKAIQSKVNHHNTVEMIRTGQAQSNVNEFYVGPTNV